MRTGGFNGMRAKSIYKWFLYLNEAPELASLVRNILVDYLWLIIVSSNLVVVKL